MIYGTFRGSDISGLVSLNLLNESRKIYDLWYL